MLRPLLATLLGLALLLPLAQAVLYWVGRLLAAAGDAAGEAVVGRVILACAALWLIDLVALLVALAVQSAGSSDDSSQ